MTDAIDVVRFTAILLRIWTAPAARLAQCKATGAPKHSSREFIALTQRHRLTYDYYEKKQILDNIKCSSNLQTVSQSSSAPLFPSSKTFQ